MESEPAIMPGAEPEKGADPEVPEALLNGQSIESDQNTDLQASKPRLPESSSRTSEKPVAQATRSNSPVQSKPVSQAAKPAAEDMAYKRTPASSAPVSSDERKYSIQAGMFGSLVNANKFLDQLHAAGFDVYMEEHQGTDGIIRYNVRFGHFASRTEAEQRLENYQQGFSTPAYVIINP
ncbi:MAG: SPOR domain-containing protein [Gammaproteobacteria bacterium]|nr:SPOR domain-containing protein [Gammaproteobacteria bacterium]